jgi:hypothetical protein
MAGIIKPFQYFLEKFLIFLFECFVFGFGAFLCFFGNWEDCCGLVGMDGYSWGTSISMVVKCDCLHLQYPFICRQLYHFGSEIR